MTVCKLLATLVICGTAGMRTGSSSVAKSKDDLSPYSCPRNEEPCEGGSGCLDVGCGGRPVPPRPSSSRCRCRPGLIRSLRTLRCLRPPPNCRRPRPSLKASVPTRPIIRRKLSGSTPTSGPGGRSPGQGSNNSSNAPAGFAHFYSLFSSQRADHLYTTSTQEVREAIQSSYVLEESLGLLLADESALTSHCANLRPLRRFYVDGSVKDHFYTTEEAEGQRARGEGYAFEGVVGHCVTFAPACGATRPLHRYYSAQLGDHLFVRKAKDFVAMRERPEWLYEGLSHLGIKTEWIDERFRNSTLRMSLSTVNKPCFSLFLNNALKKKAI